VAGKISFNIGTALVIIVGIIAVIYLLKNKHLLTGAIAGAVGNTVAGWNAYAPTGNSCSGGDGSQEIGCSGTQIWSVRSDHNSCAITNYGVNHCGFFR
jgi:hypothetical protein